MYQFDDYFEPLPDALTGGKPVKLGYHCFTMKFLWADFFNFGCTLVRLWPDFSYSYNVPNKTRVLEDYPFNRLEGTFSWWQLHGVWFVLPPFFYGMWRIRHDRLAERKLPRIYS